MDKEEYRKILECLQGKIDDKKLRKQVDTFEIRNEKLYKKKKDSKILRVLYRRMKRKQYYTWYIITKWEDILTGKECMKIQKNTLNFATIVKEEDRKEKKVT